MITEQQYQEAQKIVAQYERQLKEQLQSRFKGLTEKDVTANQGVYGQYKIPCWYIYVSDIPDYYAYILDKDDHFVTSLSNCAHNNYESAYKAVLAFLKRRGYIGK